MSSSKGSEWVATCNNMVPSLVDNDDDDVVVGTHHVKGGWFWNLKDWQHNWYVS